MAKSKYNVKNSLGINKWVRVTELAESVNIEYRSFTSKLKKFESEYKIKLLHKDEGLHSPYYVDTDLLFHYVPELRPTDDKNVQIKQLSNRIQVLEETIENILEVLYMHRLKQRPTK